MGGDVRIVGDWGSSAMRLYLCRMDGDAVTVLDRADGPGIKFSTDLEASFFDAAGGWLAERGPMSVMLSGMIGSTLGWRDCPYAPCPARLADVQHLATRFDARGIAITIAPGLRCTSIFGLPDVMRGEEMQLFGWASRAAPAGPRLVCLPGTHAKWVTTRGGAIESFFTSMQGELFEVLVGHSLVGRGMVLGADRTAITDRGEFRRGIDLMVDCGDLAVEHAVFAARSRLVTGELAAEAASSFLSGVLIGADVRDAIAAHRSRGLLDGAVVLIGAEPLCALYAQALDAAGVCSEQVSGHDAAIRGLAAFAGLVPADA